MKWTRGRADVDQLLADRRLEHVTGAAADGTALLRSAEALLESARREAKSNPEAAYVLAYDAARKAATSLVAQQGLRSKSGGHHVTVEAVVRASSAVPSTLSQRCADDERRLSTRSGRATTSSPERPRRRSPLPAESWTPRRSSGRNSSCIADRPAAASLRVNPVNSRPRHAMSRHSWGSKTRVRSLTCAFDNRRGRRAGRLGARAVVCDLRLARAWSAE
jgi:hypothetical protein